MRTYSELLEGLQKLKKQGFVESRRIGDTGIGKTLEDILGIDENNFKGPDGIDTELKAARKDSSSMLTLFTKSPLPRGVNSLLREEFGYPDEKFPTRKVLRTTIDATGYNNIKGKKGFILADRGDRLEIQSFSPPKNKDMPTPYWLKETYVKSLETKYKKSLLYVKADCQSGSPEKFHYNEAWLLHGFDANKFFEQLKNGILKVDIRLGLYDDGRYHDHGTGIRIRPDMIDLCFSSREKVV